MFRLDNIARDTLENQINLIVEIESNKYKEEAFTENINIKNPTIDQNKTEIFEKQSCWNLKENVIKDAVPIAVQLAAENSLTPKKVKFKIPKVFLNEQLSYFYKLLG